MNNIVKPTVMHKENGFTIIEVLLVIVTSCILFGPIISFSISQSNSLAIQQEVSEMIQNTRAAIDMISRELSMAGYNPSMASFDGLEYDSTQIRIRADLNGNGAVSIAGNPNEDITYRFFNTKDYPYQIKRRLINDGDSGFQPFAENIQSFNFEYLDISGNPTTISKNIIQIRVMITARTTKPDLHYKTNGGYRTYTLTSLVTPRNLAMQ